MASRWGVGDYQYEVVENWPDFQIKGVAADVAGDSQGRIYTVVRDPHPDGSIGNIRAAALSSSKCTTPCTAGVNQVRIRCAYK